MAQKNNMYLRSDSASARINAALHCGKGAWPLFTLCTRKFFPIRAQRGFTLIELVVTMIVVGILAVVALPRLSLLRGYDEVGYRDKVKATLEYARKAAVAQRRNVCVQVAGDFLMLTIENAIPESAAGTCVDPTNFPNIDATNFPRALALPVADRACGGATNQVCAPANITLTQNGNAIGHLAFSPLGRPSAAASYAVTGTDSYTITVEAETGYVH